MKKGNFFFVIQKHQATTLHYDFRLEIGNVMPSWSIPKGPSLDPKIKRLAIRTADHDLSYRTFEGIIPEGITGAGTVMIWDEGTYNPEQEIGKEKRIQITDKEKAEYILKKSLKEGELKFFLYGKKIKGSFTLIRMNNKNIKQEAWLLIKHKDKYADPTFDIDQYDYSVVTNRTLLQIASDPNSRILGEDIL